MKQQRWGAPYGMGVLCCTFLLGLILALVLPWAAIALLCLVLAAAVLMLIQMMRC